MEPGAVPAAAQDGLQKKLLIVEDESFLGDLLSAKFSKLHFNLLRAVNGEQALEIAAAEQPDIILLDLVLPGIDGFEVLKQLKAKEETKAIPVIILSNLEKGEENESKAQGCAAFLTKAHLSPADIVGKVTEILNGHASQPAVAPPAPAPAPQPSVPSSPPTTI